MTAEVIAAIHSSMRVEKNAMNYYRACAAQAQNVRTKGFFTLLSREEKEHAHTFFAVDPEAGPESNFEAFIAAPEAGAGWFGDIAKVAQGFTERQAMRFALDKEKALAEQLRATAATIDDPEVRLVYDWNARSTDHHYQMIEEEYSRLMGMVHATDVDIYVRE